MYKAVNTKGFTLVELLICLVIISILAMSGTAAYTASIRNSRDSKRKADLNNIQKALELYYEDAQRYPATLTPGSPLTYTFGGTTSTYMQSVPRDPRTPFLYTYRTDAGGTYFQVYSCIENTNDTGDGVNQVGYSAACGCGAPAACKFGIASTNIAP